MPIKSVRVEGVVNTWSAARSGGRTHEGQDIFAPRNTPIFSATEGYVIRVGQNTLGGNTVTILGAGGRRYYYAHLERYGSDAMLGNKVSTTSLIGFVGTSGNATGTPPHLHFGIYGTMGPIDPLPLMVNN